MARSRTRAERRAAKRKAPAIDVTLSEETLRSILGLILHRLWLYSKADPIPAYQVNSNITYCRPFFIEREGFTQYYR